MFLSTFDIFKIGIGPSSSHTMGPMVAAARFLDELRRAEPPQGTRLRASLHGSLAFTGKGHATDRAVILGLLGFLPDTIDPDRAEAQEAGLRAAGTIALPGLPVLVFRPEDDLVFDYGPPLPGHANGLVLAALLPNGEPLLSRTYYSIGGGFVRTADELVADRAEGGAPAAADSTAPVHPFPFTSAIEMLAMGTASGESIATMKRANETVAHGPRLDDRLDAVWAAMDGCVDRGLRQDGILPGGLSVRRRARDIHRQLMAETGANRSQPHVVNDWIAAYAMAVNEENAAGGRVVTSPTNGAAGVVPAVIRYYRDHCHGATHEGINPLKHAPHTVEDLVGEWNRSYSRESACFPPGAFRVDKYWSPVNRVDNVYGDRHLICSCPPMETYMEAAE
jgi:L-serine dehydratase